MTATRRGAPLDSPEFIGLPTAPTQTAGDATQALATDEFVSTAIAGAIEKALILGRSGVLTSAADCADVPLRVPFDMTLVGLVVTVLSAPSGAMSVQLRHVAGPITTAPPYASLSGFVAVFVAGQVTAEPSVAPSPIDVAAGDFLNFSCATASGTNLLVEAVAQV